MLPAELALFPSSKLDSSYICVFSVTAFGHANAMNGNLWFDWRKYIRTAYSTELFFALYLTTAFCARITEVLMLRAQDFDWDREQVHFGAFKYGRSTDKPMVPSVKKQLLGVKRNEILCPSKWVKLRRPGVAAPGRPLTNKVVEERARIKAEKRRNKVVEERARKGLPAP